MASEIQNLIHSVLKDGARSTKFEVLIAMPRDFYKDQSNISVLAKSASFPGKTHDIVDLKYRGRSIPVKGQTKYTQTWDCTFYMTEDHALKTAFENWIDFLDQAHNYKDKLQFTGKDGYTGAILANQLTFDLDEAKTEYYLYNVFPIAITQVDTDYTAVGTILEFTVTFAYTHYDTNVNKKQKTIVDELVDLGRKKLEKKINSVKDTITKEITENTTKLLNRIGAGFSSSVKDEFDLDVQQELNNMKEKLK